MRSAIYLRNLAIFLASLIVMLPVAFADSLTWDENGNLEYSELDGLFRVYNSENKLWKIYNGTDGVDPDTGWLLQEYVHDLVEERILMKKTYNSSGDVTEKVIYVTKDYVRVKNETGVFDTLYINHEGQLIAQKNVNDSTTYYFHPDNVGSVTLVTDSSGNVVENSSFDPYGNIISGGETSRFDYEAKEYDSVVGDYDFGFRKYISDIQVWAQPDSLIINFYSPQSLNRYSFEMNSPWNRVDPDGHIAPVVVAGATIFGIGFVIGAIQEGIRQSRTGEYNIGRIGLKGAEAGVAALGTALVISAVTAGSSVLGPVAGGIVAAGTNAYFDAKDTANMAGYVSTLEAPSDILTTSQGVIDEENPPEITNEDKKRLGEPDGTTMVTAPPSIDLGGGGGGSSGTYVLDSNKGDNGGSNGGGGGGGQCTPSCHTSCSKTHGGGQVCYTVCTVC